MLSAGQMIYEDCFIDIVANIFLAHIFNHFSLDACHHEYDLVFTFKISQDIFLLFPH